MAANENVAKVVQSLTLSTLKTNATINQVVNRVHDVPKAMVRSQLRSKFILLQSVGRLHSRRIEIPLRVPSLISSNPTLGGLGGGVRLDSS